MWSPGQKKAIAKDLIALTFSHGRAATFLTGTMREALVDAHLFSVVRHQDGGTVEVEALDDLRVSVYEELCKKFGPGFFE